MFVDLQDVYNVQRDYGLRFQGSSSDEFESLSTDYREQQELDSSDRCLLYYKRPGQADSSYPEVPVLHFIAVVQTQYEREMLRKHGSKGVCIDSTHGCFAEDVIKLTTLLVLDENERGIPVGHCFLSSEDTASCKVFFDVLRGQLEDLEVQWFLSDDADAFFTAWSEILPNSPAQKTLCTWHVLKNVYAGINRRERTNQNSAQAIKVSFRNVMYAESADRVQSMLSELRSMLIHHPTTSEYLEGTYLNHRNGLSRVAQWALAYRVGSLMSTSSFVESFHR